jgi:hypothetical protein
MSSSKLHQLEQQKLPTPLPSPKESRNQSEPPPVEKSNLNASSTTSIGLGANTSPLSKRSSSVYTLPRDAPIPRLCRVRAYEEQLGFTIAGSKANRGIFKVNDVTPNSPAAHSGLLNDDFIIEISGVNVENLTYQEVVEMIRNKKQEDDLQLLVADRATIQWYKSKKVPISSQVVPKMQYIETLFKEELMQADSEENNNLDSSFNNNSNSESKLIYWILDI